MWWTLLVACGDPPAARPKPTESPAPLPSPVPAPVPTPVPAPGHAPPAPGAIRSSADADAALLGGAQGDLFGDNAAATGDVDGDGKPDAWLGAKGALEDAGAGWLFAGPPAGAPVAVRTGEAPGDFAGGGLAGASDVDGDGRADVLIGAKLSDRGAEGAGAAWLLRGPLAGEASLLSADAVFTGDLPGDEAGGSLAGSPALLLIAATAADFGGAGSGSVYLVPPSAPSGPLAAHPRIDGLAPGDNCGGNLAFLGDTSGDGLPDFAIACGGADPDGLSAAGEVYVFAAIPAGSGPISMADARIHGTEPLQVAGAVTGPGDLTGDGAADLLIGAPGDATGGFLAGAAFVVAGPVDGDVPLTAAVATLLGAGGDWAGFAVAGAGDLDADGSPDALVGGPGAHDETGAAWWIPGPIAGVWPLADAGGALVGLLPGDQVGHAVAGLGDTDGDGVDDALIGAPGAGGTGAAYVILGGP
jgi:hypothetical protein